MNGGKRSKIVTTNNLLKNIFSESSQRFPLLHNLNVFKQHFTNKWQINLII